MRTGDVGVLLDYLYWVRDRVLEAAHALPDEEFTSSVTVTTRNLRATLVHELDVQWSWRERLRSGTFTFPDADDLDPLAYPSVAALAEHWRRDEAEMREWLAGVGDEDLEAPPVGELDGLPLAYYAMHIVTHGVQQLSEAAVLLTRAGHSPGELGFLEFVRRRPA